MNVHFDEKTYQKASLINYLFGKGKVSTSKSNTKSPTVNNRDTVTISAAGQALATSNVHSKGSNRNTNIDKTIDLQSYIDEVKKENEAALQDAGTSINAKGLNLKTYKDALYSALTDKYSRLVQEAKSHSNPEAYLRQKYFDSSSSFYQSNLSDEERSAGYNSEMDMLKNGKLSHTYYQDSLFRGMSFDTDQEERYQLQRRTVNQQISNIFQQAGINQSDIPETCKFEVDPYSYRISVSGVDDDTKAKMENALNVGDNGKNLFIHISHATQQGKAENTQVDKVGLLKYQASAAVKEYTGLNLNEMRQEGSEYFTPEGKSIRDIVKEAIEKNVGEKHRSEANSYLSYLLDEVGKINWKNSPNMVLGILYSQKGLKDIGQELVFDGYSQIGGDKWYSVL